MGKLALTYLYKFLEESIVLLEGGRDSVEVVGGHKGGLAWWPAPRLGFDAGQAASSCTTTSRSVIAEFDKRHLP